MTPAPTREAHRAAMDALQAEMHAKIRAAKRKGGLVIVHTGDGKGKTTAAFGMLTRMLAYGKTCAVVQFIKAGPDPVEKLLRSPRLHWHRIGNGFTWDTKDRDADVANCRKGWDLAKAYLASSAVDFVLLDELNIVLGADYLPIGEVLSALRSRPAPQHAVVTGRGAPPELMAAADLVTDMREVKHPFRVGIMAQPGIDF